MTEEHEDERDAEPTEDRDAEPTEDLRSHGSGVPLIDPAAFAPKIDAAAILRNFVIPPIDTAAMLRDFVAPPIDTIAMLRDFVIPPIDTIAMLRDFVIPPIDTTAMLRNALGPDLARNLVTSFSSVPVVDVLGVWREASSLSDDTRSTERVLDHVRAWFPQLSPEAVRWLAITWATAMVLACAVYLSMEHPKGFDEVWDRLGPPVVIASLANTFFVASCKRPGDKN